MRRNPLTLIWALYFFASSALWFVGAVLICALTAPFDKNRRILHRYASLWGSQYVTHSHGWRVTYEGLEKIDESKTYVLIANHQSLWDIFALYGIYKPYKWVSKEEVFNVPFVGWNMRLNQYVSILRGDRKSIKEMMDTCMRWLNQGASILMFPEGTRSEDGEIHDFRDGAFRLSQKCSVPIVPIIVDGTRDILPKKSKNINFQARIFVKVLDPIDPANFSGPGEMRDFVRKQMIEALSALRSSNDSKAKQNLSSAV